MIFNRYLFLLGLLFSTSFLYAAGDTPQVSIFPNPTNGPIKIDIITTTAEQVTLDILNLQGQSIHHSVANFPSAGQHLLIRDLRNYTVKEGIYFTSCLFKSSGITVTKKLVLINLAPILASSSFDILHTRIDLSIKNLNIKSISGTVIHQLVVTVDSLDKFSFNLLKLQVSLVTVNNIAAGFNQSDSVLNITTPVKYKRGDTLQIAVQYGGKPVADATWGGFYFNGNFAYNLGVGFTANPHSFGRCWFPCIDDFNEKGTYSFRITTDSGWKAVCNGLLQYDSVNVDGSHTFGWEEYMPMPAYLASVAVGKYEWVKLDFKGMLKNYPVWIAAEAKDTANARASLIHLLDALSCFESKFGPYPFERVGYVGVPFNAGAMEHAGNIAYPNYALNGLTNNETLFAHELSHMWWGDKVTCKTAGDMWLNEGWASFCEAVFLECLYGRPAYDVDIKDKINTVMLNAAKNDGAFYPVSGVPHQATYGTHVYKKGALVAHTLRTLMGDSAFFAACKSYLNKYTFNNASSEDMMLEFQKFTSVNLNAFFNNWVYQPGFEEVAVTAYQLNGDTLSIKYNCQTRYHDVISEPVPMIIDAYDSTGNVHRIEFMAIPGHHEKTIIIDWYKKYLDYIIVNPNHKLAWGVTSNKTNLTKIGLVNVPEVLVGLNVSTFIDSDTFQVWSEHHWTGPYAPELSKKSIRISKERYWHFEAGKSRQLAQVYAFLNYDGSTGSFLDNELLKNVTSEDSIILLWRDKSTETWNEYTNCIFQPGSNKADKVGRFWLKELISGDYAFGVRDFKASGIQEETLKTGLKMDLIPNPSKAETKVQFNLPITGKLTLTDINGRCLIELNLKKQDRVPLETNQYPGGIYFVSFKGEQGTITRRLQISN